MGVDAGHSREEARIGDAEHPDASVVAGYVLEQPRDGIEGIGALVDTVRVGHRVQRAIHDEPTLACVSAPDVLRDEDVSVCREEAIALSDYRIAGYAVRRSS